ncbi:hypothetical protein P171DRAFT_179709 [Karstenula rhodostoma CBS 690.94]|uniref:Uncharacterized protein n=1 Tax=Karstenula rhodostoma CBS 690.94 TaxID=1392251 RepID=A0A9P4P6I5_9PLEO|nr:hypothetical protein P171DRAFT_179709 [Karstenula rhodostoma CBS 690.94]
MSEAVGVVREEAARWTWFTLSGRGQRADPGSMQRAVTPKKGNGARRLDAGSRCFVCFARARYPLCVHLVQRNKHDFAVMARPLPLRCISTQTFPLCYPLCTTSSERKRFVVLSSCTIPSERKRFVVPSSRTIHTRIPNPSKQTHRQNTTPHARMSTGKTSDTPRRRGRARGEDRRQIEESNHGDEAGPSAPAPATDLGTCVRPFVCSSSHPIIPTCIPHGYSC